MKFNRLVSTILTVSLIIPIFADPINPTPGKLGKETVYPFADVYKVIHQQIASGYTRVSHGYAQTSTYCGSRINYLKSCIPAKVTEFYTNHETCVKIIVGTIITLGLSYKGLMTYFNRIKSNTDTKK